MSFLKPLTTVAVRSRIFLVAVIVAVGIPLDADAKWKWKTIPADEAVLKLKGWPTPTDQCRVRKGNPPNYAKENTVFFCPRWLGDDEPRTYFKISELMPGWFWGGGYVNEFSEHPIFTKAKGNWFKYFKNPQINEGQKTECYNDNECHFRRIVFSVKGQKCQWLFYLPDLGNTDGISGRSETPYALEIFTCQTSVPITKEHIEMKPGKVTVTFPGSEKTENVGQREEKFSYTNKTLYFDQEAGPKLANTTNEKLSEYFEYKTFISPEKISAEDEAKLTRSRIVNSFLTKRMPRAMFGAFPPQCNARHWGASDDIVGALYNSKAGCQRKFALTNLITKKKCDCRIIAFNNIFFYSPDVYMTYEGNTDYVSSNLLDGVKRIFSLEDQKICTEALDKPGDNWSRNETKSDYVNLAKYRGLDVDTCREERRMVNASKQMAKSPSPPPAPPQKKPKMVYAKIPEGDAEKRSIAVQWEGKENLISGYVKLPRKNSGKINFTIPDSEETCSGMFAYSGGKRGVWSIACTSGETASGTFKPLGPGKGSTGIGTDNKGKTVRFTVGAR